jgi:predicted metal-dependent phosphoesterase TrpH
LIKADLHVHTWHSIDSNMSYEQLIKACLEKGINCAAVADHGTTKGARDLLRIAPFKIIVCEEVATPYGEIMGMFLQEDIPAKLPVAEAIKAIREQGGLVNIPHPFDRVRPSAFRNLKMLESIADQIDIVEVFNSRSLFPGAESRARAFAAQYNKIISYGSDGHSPSEVGCSYVEMNDFNTREEFLSSLSSATLFGRKSSPLIHIISSAARFRKLSGQGG